MEQKRVRKRHFVRWIFLVVLAVAIVTAAVNWKSIYDWYLGVVYTPSVEMVTIREKLGLTDEGKFIFNATQPILSEAKEFNQNCRQEESETAVLGCYKNGNIYIYNITAAELDGIRELTTAHELLHAKWARMNEDERRGLTESLTHVFEDNQELLESEIEPYEVSERQEELYVRAGTEVKELPEELEKHYGEIFEDQDKIVDFYESYIVVFREIKMKMAGLLEEMEVLKEDISAYTADYEQQAAQLEADIVSFNSCAGVEGCFDSEWEFYAQRRQLLVKQGEIENLNEKINNLIDKYNEKVEEYNADVTESRKLQDMINSNTLPEVK